MVKIFRCTDQAQDVLDTALEAGIVGISGGRLSVRRLLSQVHQLAVDGAHENITANATYNHPETELAYIFDLELYDSAKAKSKVIAAFDRALSLKE